MSKQGYKFIGEIYQCMACGVLLMDTECTRHRDLCSQREKLAPVSAETQKDHVKFTWNVHVSEIAEKPVSSRTFFAGSFPWVIKLCKTGTYLSVYLAVGQLREARRHPMRKRKLKSVIRLEGIEFGWRRCAQFSLLIINQEDPKRTIRKDTEHIFNGVEPTWGFRQFLNLNKILDSSMGYQTQGRFTVEVIMKIPSESDWSHDSRKEAGYDSRKETSYLGLKGYGSNSYLNSFLQILYHIPCLRKFVYHLHYGTDRVELLQRIMYMLQFGDTSVSTKYLTRYVCGMDQYNHNLNNVVFNFVRQRLGVEGTLQELFEGKCMRHLDMKSIETISFYDLLLDIEGCEDVYASFDRYVEVGLVGGDHAEQYGLLGTRKSSRMRVLFIEFPPVLFLRVRRFENCCSAGTFIKINDGHAFPLLLDLDRENGKYLSPDADRNVRNLYTLWSVVFHNGHFCSYIRPNLSRKWFKFDNERVIEEDISMSLVELNHNSHMLVYVRVSDEEKIVCNVDEEDIPESLRMKLKNELEEKVQKKKVKHMTHRIVKVARSEDLQEQIGKNIYFDLVDHDTVRSFCIDRNMEFRLFKEKVAKEFGVPVDCQRFWLWAKRDNFTYRVHRPLHLEYVNKPKDVEHDGEANCSLVKHHGESENTKGKSEDVKKHEDVEHDGEANSSLVKCHGESESTKVGRLRELNDVSLNGELKLFLEVQLGQDLQPVPPPLKSKEDILLFFKHYDPLKEKLRYVGMLFVKKSGRPSEILTKLNEMAGFAPDQEIELYEEVQFKPEMKIKHIEMECTFCASQLKDGDIVCFQKSLPVESAEQCRYPDVSSFLHQHQG